jgi:uncharacterized lipoprotein YmbA
MRYWIFIAVGMAIIAALLAACGCTVPIGPYYAG